MQLFREIGFASSTFLVVGNIIGVGIFTTSGLIAEQVGPSLWVLGVWVLGGILALMGATCYALIGLQIPKAGGEYALLYPFYGPLPAFLSGWTSLLIGFSAPIAASALGLAHYLRPLLAVEGEETILSLKITATAVLIGTSLLLSIGLRFGTFMHSTLTVLNLALTFGFAAFVLYRAPARDNLGPIFEAGFAGPGLLALGPAVVLVMFAYSGWNAAVYVSEEIRSPRRNIPAALLTGSMIVIVAYLLLNMAYFTGSPFAELTGRIAVAEITATNIFGARGGLLVNVLILFSILSSLTAMSIAGPRVYFAMARDRLMPRWLSDVDQKRRLPLKSAWFQSMVALALIWIGTFQQILLYSGFIMLLFATLTVSCLFKIKEGPRFGPSLYRVVPALFMLVNIAMLTGAAVSHPRETTAGALTVAAGIPVYYLYRRRGEKQG
jgi:basic amino acid/polyamine antiporter, APA family